jgi:hypothetical protein
MCRSGRGEVDGMASLLHGMIPMAPPAVDLHVCLIHPPVFMNATGVFLFWSCPSPSLCLSESQAREPPGHVSAKVVPRCRVRPPLTAHLLAAQSVPLTPHAPASCWSAGLPEPEAPHVIRPRALRSFVGDHHPSRADLTCDHPVAERRRRKYRPNMGAPIWITPRRPVRQRDRNGGRELHRTLGLLLDCAPHVFGVFEGLLQATATGAEGTRAFGKQRCGPGMIQITLAPVRDAIAETCRC